VADYKTTPQQKENIMFDDIIGAADLAFGAEDIVGGYSELDALFSGAGPMIVTGANAGTVQDGSVSKAQLAQTLMARNSAMVVQRGVTKAREFPLGFPTTAIAATATANIQTQPQVPFRGRRMTIPSDIAGSILVNDLKIGNASMFPNSNPVPGRMFSELAVGIDLNLDTAQISQVVSLNVTNTSGGAVTFNAAIIGTVVY
jgi:hypothetical protein